MANRTLTGVDWSTAGDWGKRPLYLDEYEIMVIARKAA